MNGGNGTKAPSYAIAEYLNNNDNQAVVIDIMAEANPIGDMLCNVYNYFLRHSIFSASAYMEFAHAFPIDRVSIFNIMGSSRSQRVISEEQPDAVILICPWISRMTLLALEKYREKQKTRPMVFVDVVDLGKGMTTSWVNNDVDFTFLPTENAFNYLTTHGLNNDQILVSGVPLHREFSGGPINEQEKRETRKKHELNLDDNMITILGGREGGNYTEKILNKLLKAFPDTQFIVQCGLNKKLHLRIKRIAISNKNVHPVGFVKSMRELYSVSDVVITKPGAITISELVVSNVPFILNAWPVVMPQERGNVNFVEENGFGITAYNLNGLPNVINNILAGKDKKFAEKSDKEIRKNLYGTARIGDKIIELVNSNSKIR
ncbi:MGDG synthase family glycosyltransferase [[Eubacterium] cellulosolvens]